MGWHDSRFGHKLLTSKEVMPSLIKWFLGLSSTAQEPFMLLVVGLIIWLNVFKYSEDIGKSIECQFWGGKSFSLINWFCLWELYRAPSQYVHGSILTHFTYSKFIVSKNQWAWAKDLRPSEVLSIRPGYSLLPCAWVCVLIWLHAINLQKD